MFTGNYWRIPLKFEHLQLKIIKHAVYFFCNLDWRCIKILKFAYSLFITRAMKLGTGGYGVMPDVCSTSLLSAFWFPEKLTKRFLSNSHKHHLGVCMCLFGAMTFDLHFLIVSQTLRLYCPKKMKFKVFKTTNTCTIICLLRLHKYGSIKLLKEDNVMIKWGPTGVNQDCDLSKKSEVLSLRVLGLCHLHKMFLLSCAYTDYPSDRFIAPVSSHNRIYCR